MKLKKLIISFFLLFVYSISFAHSLTYHEHGFYSEHQHEFVDVENNTHKHDHHSHTKQLETTTSHIHHNDHCDEGVLDLITCVLSDLSNHQHDDCHLEHQPNDETKRLSNKNYNKLHTYSEIVPLVDLCKQTNSFSNHLIIGFQISIISDNPLRGPPSYC